jgi:hypothetical protein
MTDLYPFAGEDTLGITSCAPVIQETYSETTKFRGAVCLDIAPMGNLNQYFSFPENKNAHYLIYNPDEAFNEQDVDNSDFFNTTKDLILKEYDQNSIEMNLNHEAARLFDEEKITWGEVSAIKKDSGER